jgi:aspartate kinase
VAGYQGVSYRREITTLGRGGSDTTAVALAAALDASACEIYSDVEGVLSADPRIVSDARQLSHIGYEEMQEMASSGARVLNAAAVEFAKERGIALFARKTGSPNPGTVVRRDIPLPAHGVRSIAHDPRVAVVEAPGHLGKELLTKLDILGAHPKQISHSGSISCIFGLEDLHNRAEVAQAAEGLGAVFRDDLGTVSLIGEGITHDLSVMMRAFKALPDMEVGGVSTSRFRITLLLPVEGVTEAVRLLHDQFGLAHPSADAVLT